MSAYHDDGHVQLHHGDCLEVMADLPEASVDAVVTDPPYGLSFMGREWDRGVPGVPFWREMLRVAKPGAHLLSFAGTRTYHRIATAIEDAGWEIRDMAAWVYAEGFPKGPDVGRQIDMELCTQPGRHWMRTLPAESKRQPDDHVCPETDDGRAHYGESTTLKPAWEPIAIARKPMGGRTIATNVREHGTGALQIDATRLPIHPDDEVNDAVWTVRESGMRPGTTGFVSSNEQGDRRAARPQRRSAPQSDPANRTGVVGRDLGFSKGDAEQMHAAQQRSTEALEQLGRWPANVILTDPEPFDVPNRFVVGSGRDAPSRVAAGVTYPGDNGGWHATAASDSRQVFGYGDLGGPARFFLIPKADRSERERGLAGAADRPRANTHPTVKPIDLMRHLVRLATPPGGTVLDPFLGSGTTALAASEEGRRCIGIEQQEEYLVIARGRLIATPIGLGL